MKKRWITYAVFAAALLLLPELLSACPNCKEAYMSDGQTPVSSGFNTSIYFMMAMPFLVFGGFTLRLWLAHKRQKAEGSQV
ncbi:MAG: hypothetical protein IH600_07885 [Bacteroidetes bacterium]|nr:hypothetical protein [Bacteroidota bacterium]